jgi:hypothetical protein
MNFTGVLKPLSIFISIELVLSPLTGHRAFGTPPTSNGTNKRTEVLSTVLDITGSIYNQVQGQRPNPAQANLNQQMNIDMVHLQGQVTPQPDKYFNLQLLSKIPGLSDYLYDNRIDPNILNCSTLPTTLYEARPEVCRIGATSDKGIPQDYQRNQMYTYSNQYLQISKAYTNFSPKRNGEDQRNGVGCMKNAMGHLNGFFKYRLDEMDKLKTELEAKQNDIRKKSRSDLDAIEEAVAVLDGNSKIADKVRTKRPDLFDFKSRFNNPACNSIFAGDKLNETGRDNGLNQINQDLKKAFSEKKGKFSGESYANAHSSVLEDLNSLADNTAKQFELNFGSLSKDSSAYSGFLSNLSNSVSSVNGSQNALKPDLFSDVQTKFNERLLKLNDQKNTIQSELRTAGIPSQAATDLLGNPVSDNFEYEVSTLENQLKNKCFSTTISSIGKEKIMKKIYDPTASSHANKNASNFLKDKLNNILNSDLTLERKLEEIKTLETQTKNRYFLKMDQSYEVQDVDEKGNLRSKVVGASTIKSPSAFFSDIIGNCNAQFKANKLNNKLTGANAIKNLRSLIKEYQNLSKSQAAEMKNVIKKRLINCETPEVANNTAPGSCTSDRFDTSAPGFCAAAALSCSKNMESCSQQASSFVKTIQDKKTKRVNHYKQMMEKNKDYIVRTFDTALSRYMIEGKTLRGMFGAGFSSPNDIQREVPEKDRYLDEFQDATKDSLDGTLLLENPEKYLEMFKKNIDLLKTSVQKQQDQILGGESVGEGKNPGILNDHITETEENYKKVISEAEKISKDCLKEHDKIIKAAKDQGDDQQRKNMEKMSELGEKRNKFCRMYSMASRHPKGACSENLQDIIDSGYEGIAVLDPRKRQQAYEEVTDFYEYCSQFAPFDDKSEQDAFDICVRKKDNPKYTEFCETLNNPCEHENLAENKVSNCETNTTKASKSIIALYKYESSISGNSTKLGDAAAYCGAENDTGREIPKGIIDIVDELKKANPNGVAE